MMLSNLRRFTFLWGALLFMVTLLMMYTMLETLNSSPRRGNSQYSQNYAVLESKMEKIEKDIASNREFMKKMKANIEAVLAGNDVGDIDSLDLALKNQDNDANLPADEKKERKEETYEVAIYNGAVPSKGVCTWVSKAESKADIKIQKVLDLLPFDNPDGGVWKQGWEVTYPANRWNAHNKLKVVLIPHSHCDPGWIMTYAEYYRKQTKQILNNFVPKLRQNAKHKFMFSEMSYFHWWWSEIDEDTKQEVKKLLGNGQFEISSGGWVMPDEANAHYYAMLDQLIEGHQWLNNTLGYVPKSSWSIDPFGYSSTMAYILKRSEFKSMLIQRVHYSIKKHLAKETSLEFMWRQHWDSAANTDIFTHMMPFYSYDVPHTCGPDPKICCQFDFRRLPGSSVRCPWKVNPKAINDQNVAERSATIADQWKKKATLYKHDVLLVPLGDDFRYMEPDEFDKQFGNYEKIFKYLEQHPEIGVEPQFGTLSDYFNTLYDKTGVLPGHAPPQTPSLSGDFFSYADRDDHYWTGYFTSRPWAKHLDRSLEHNLRSAEIIFTLAQATAGENLRHFPTVALMKKLVEARRNLAVFQHHDGITGTAKDFVNVDYATRLLKGFHDSKKIIVECSVFLTAESKAKYVYTESEAAFSMDEVQASHKHLPQRPVMSVTTEPKSVLVYNSLGQPRTEVVKLWTNWPHVVVLGPEGQPVHSQTEPFWIDKTTMAADKFKVSFVADLPGLSVRRYKVTKVAAGQDTHNHLVSVTLLSPSGTLKVKNPGVFSFQSQPTNKGIFKLDSNFLSATFSGSSGLLQSVQMLATGKKFKSEVDFIQYGTTTKQDKSGAYLFLPDGDATPLLKNDPELIRVVRGPITREVNVYTQYIQHVVRVHNSPGTDGSSIDIFNIVDIRTTRNREVGIRIQTDVENSERVFYSDLNGFQMQKRKYRAKLTLQGNVYPMPSMAYLQDGKSRVSVLSAQSLGVANLVPGAIDVMLDRRLNQDDNRGLGQGVLDNQVTPNRFRLLFESRTTPTQDVAPESSFPSLLGHQSSLALIHPMFVMPRSDHGEAPPLQQKVDLLHAPLSCEVHLLNLRSLQNSDESKDQFIPKASSLLLLRHLASDCSFPAPSLSCSANDGQVTVSELFSGVRLERSHVTSLTMARELSEVKAGQALQVAPMEITAVKLDYKR